MNDSRDAITRFRELYGKGPELMVEAPGRINLIGGYTDCNQGYVLPVAIDRKALFLSSARDDDLVRLYSSSLATSGEMRITEGDEQDGWLRYPGGILDYVSGKGLSARGIDLLIDGDLPAGSGLASSAALEVGFLSSISHHGGFDLSSKDIVTICHRVETDFVGMKCGVMDQFAVVMGRKGKAIFLDCRDTTHRYMDFDDDAISILLFDSGVRRELVGSDYNTRREECLGALHLIQTGRPEIPSLRDLSPADLSWLEDVLEPGLFRRCRHVVREISRVEAAADSLQSGNISALGKLVKASHMSLRDDFEVSCEELDHLFATANEQEGVYGSRLTGAGFGGALLVLCEPARVDSVVEAVKASFLDRFGRHTEAILCASSNGLDAGWL